MFDKIKHKFLMVDHSFGSENRDFALKEQRWKVTSNNQVLEHVATAIEEARPSRPRVRKSRYCPPSTAVTQRSLPTCSVANSKRLFLYTVCCRRGCQCFSVLRTRNQMSL